MHIKPSCDTDSIGSGRNTLEHRTHASLATTVRTFMSDFSIFIAKKYQPHRRKDKTAVSDKRLLDIDSTGKLKKRNYGYVLDSSWETRLSGDGERFTDIYGRTIYRSKWFRGFPTIADVLFQEVRDLGLVGYNIPQFENKAIIKLWWSITDVEFEYTAPWVRIFPYEFNEWLKKLGFTGWSKEPNEWKIWDP